VVVNHVAFLVALIGVQRISLRHTSVETTRLAVWLTALGPLGFVFSMLYPSALFLAASVWAFLWVEERRDLAAGCAAAVAALSRPDGILVAIVLIFTVGWMAPRIVRIVAPAALAMGGWVGFNALRTGDPLRFIDAKAAWPEVTIMHYLQHPTGLATLHLAIAAAALALVLGARDGLPRSWSWYTAAYLLPSLALGVIGLARYASEAFPAYVAGAVVTERRGRTTLGAVIAGVVGLQVVCCYVFIARGRLI
jgi:hypothetical protein